MRAWILASALALSGCAGGPTPAEPQVVYREVRIPVAVSCVPARLRAAPSYKVTRETLKAAPAAADRYQLAVGGFIEREQRLAEVEPVIAACRKAGGPP